MSDAALQAKLAEVATRAQAVLAPWGVLVRLDGGAP